MLCKRSEIMDDTNKIATSIYFIFVRSKAVIVWTAVRNDSYQKGGIYKKAFVASWRHKD